MFAIFQFAFLTWLLLRVADCARPTGNVVYPRLLETRGLDAEKILYIQDDIVLRLRKTSVLTEGVVFSENIDGRRVDKIMNGKELEADMYHDRNRMASVNIKERSGGIEVKGILSDTLRIAPLDINSRSNEGPIPHEILKVEQRAVINTTYKVEPEIKNSNDTFYAELRIVVDDNHRDVFNSSEDLVQYLALGMKLVNIRYEETSKPKVQFLLTTVEVARTEFSDAQFIAADVDCPSRSQKYYMNPINMIEKAVKLYGNGKEDITVVITSVDLADNFNGHAYNHVMGQAKLGGLCSDGRRVAIVEDAPPTYSLIQIIAHELAHTLGATHDGDATFKDIAHITNKTCSSYTGHMMAPSAHGSNNGHFSNCSIEQIRAFVSKLNSSCRDVKLETYHITTKNVLPGTKMDLVDYCRTKHSNFPNITATQPGNFMQKCKLLCCAESGYPCFEEPAVDGMSCDNDKYCLRHKCGNHTNPLDKIR
ncbi:venom metalloproteinase antarease-like TtrivMP_A [Ixodes scapularis]|uniref:venom metalloproteinase antarease-like TtrivMP_A n=1 Tax=Ixodes scapularis TaxID=6945 RepID=UPI001A9DD534|nr:venom metalloproteinase antarease-like TtrivMP_A [Ixodes scapularis]